MFKQIQLKTHRTADSILAIARYFSFQQTIRQPLRPHMRGPASGAGARSPSLSRCFVFVWPSSHVVYFFWPNLLLPAWPIMCVISSFFTAQIFGILEIGNMWGPQISSSPNYRQGRRWIFKICAFFSLSLIWLFRFPSHLIWPFRLPLSFTS